MTSFVTEMSGRTLLIHLRKGDDVLQCIRSEIERLGIRSAIVLSGIGSLNKARYHYIGSTDEQPNDVFETVEEPLELAALQGLILEGKPHLHVVLSTGGNQCYAGHLEEGCQVQYLAEIAIAELPGLRVGRKTEPETGVSYMAWLEENASERS